MVLLSNSDTEGFDNMKRQLAEIESLAEDDETSQPPAKVTAGPRPVKISTGQDEDLIED